MYTDFVQNSDEDLLNFADHQDPDLISVPSLLDLPDLMDLLDLLNLLDLQYDMFHSLSESYQTNYCCNNKATLNLHSFPHSHLLLANTHEDECGFNNNYNLGMPDP